MYLNCFNLLFSSVSLSNMNLALPIISCKTSNSYGSNALFLNLQETLLYVLPTLINSSSLLKHLITYTLNESNLGLLSAAEIQSVSDHPVGYSLRCFDIDSLPHNVHPCPLKCSFATIENSP